MPKNEEPLCPACGKSRMDLSLIEPGQIVGFDYRTFNCRECGEVSTMIVSNDPSDSNTRGWLEGKLWQLN